MDNKSMDVILDKLPGKIRSAFERCKDICADRITELSLRAGRPFCVYKSGKPLFLTEQGFLIDSVHQNDLIYSTFEDIKSTVLRMCDYSVYSYQNQINSGYITIENGVRVGLCGQAVIREGKISNIRDITSLNFRVSREIKGCSKELLSLINPLKGVLICGQPSSGKTTLIRDIARELSYIYRVSVLDERNEISAVCRGKNGFDIGLCDVFSGYPKGTAALSAIRGMSPDIIVCDELGDREDVDMLMNSLRCGVSFIATVHADSMPDLRARRSALRIISSNAFESIVFLKGRHCAGSIDRIYEMRKNDA